MGNSSSVDLSRYLVHSNNLQAGQSGELVHFTRQSVNWEWMSFQVRRLSPGEVWETHNDREETGVVILGGRCWADWGKGRTHIGERKNVFDGLPFAIYLPAGAKLRMEADTELEFAACSVPSTAKHPARLITPADVETGPRGGGNASRQIVNIMKPDFPADKLILVEVYTPSGNWSSFPPHKHDVHNPPTEVDLDEIYYYKIDRPGGFAHQRLYQRNGGYDVTVSAVDGDVVLVRDGYHPVVAGHGYNVYYLNCLAGSERSLANTEDPDHVWVRETWGTLDPRLPLIRGASSS